MISFFGRRKEAEGRRRTRKVCVCVMANLWIGLYIVLGVGAFVLFCAICWHFCFENPQTRVSDCYDVLNRPVKGASINNSRGAGGNDPVACV